MSPVEPGEVFFDTASEFIIIIIITITIIIIISVSLLQYIAALGMVLTANGWTNIELKLTSYYYVQCDARVFQGTRSKRIRQIKKALQQVG